MHHRFFSMWTSSQYIEPIVHISRLILLYRSLSNGERDITTTMVCCVDASGTQYVPPMIMFKRKLAPQELRDGAPPGSVVTCYDYGCMDGRERKMFYLTTHSTHFIYGYMASDIWLRTILIVRKENRCRHIGYSYRLTARVLLYAPSHRQDNTYHGLCYTSRAALAGTRNSSMGPPHEGSIRRPTAP